ncbi:MAG: response regulator [Spirochaetaceae bacterium]|jgi:signal transduction histidine kinase/AmiR/NasT family two-component response regulator/HPt (histidine-containing phosphotransfer) domain-containing protein|nr:response regulator [Spirochaetaceae bacterium]
MISIRSKVRLIIIAIVIVITLSSLGLSMLFNQNTFLNTVTRGLVLICRISEKLIANEIGLIKERVRVTAGLAVDAAPEELPAILHKELERRRYLSLAVLDARGIIARAGGSGAGYEAYRQDRNFRRSLRGETLICSTRTAGEDGMVFRVWAPAGKGRILAADIPGMLFAGYVSNYRIWQTGNIYILDSEGTVIAHYDPGMVNTRHNYIELGKTDPRWKSAGDFFSLMIQGGSGVGTYTWNGVKRLCAYEQIEGSDNWVLGVTAPLRESPLAQINRILLSFAAVFLILGLSAAVFAANSIAKPFEQIREQNARLEELKKTAEKASECKTRFLANMSHEMRTPLNAIIGLTELGLGSGELSGNAFVNMEKIYVSGMTLLGIINDILDISKIESGKFVLFPAKYDIPKLINDTITQNLIRIGSKPIKFNLHAEDTLPQTLIGDELRIKQIFNNLLSNAFKYTEKGTVDWYISSKTEGNSVWLMSSIRDTGSGIRQEDIPKLFTDYNQIHLKSNFGIESTGLGLPITKDLVNLMDGSVTVESEYGKGSVFSIRIRQQYADGQSIGRETAQNLSALNYTAEGRSAKEKLVRAWIPYAAVLVVDDLPVNLDVAREMMKPYGMTVDCVESGQRAIDLIREGKIKYNAVFMDHMMPKMDGIKAVQIIRNEIGTGYAQTVPIIALTANAITGSEGLFLKSGFQSFLSKPIDIIQLDMVINRFVRNKDLERELFRSEKTAPLPPEPWVEAKKSGPGILAGKSLEGVDFNAGLKRFADSEEMYLNILSSFFSQIPPVLEKLRNYTEEALGEEYRIAVHNLKSTSYTIGAQHIGSMAEELERAAVSGDKEFVKSRNGTLISALEKLLPALGNLLEELAADIQKPVRPAPDPALLAAVLDACSGYNMEELDKAMAELEQYRYESQGDLVAWIREESGKSELENIKERLKGLNKSKVAFPKTEVLGKPL